MEASRTFAISDSAAEQYKALRYDPDARQVWSIIPFNTIVWEDEHPSEDTIFRMDDESRMSILQLVWARTDLWLNGRVPPQLQLLWDEAKDALPDWPGFRRLALTEQEQEALRRFQAEYASIEDLFAEGASELSKTEDATGVVHFEATFDLRERPKRSWWKFWS